MNFNEKQSKQIYDFVINYNLDENFKKTNEELYDTTPEKMPILHIYALEEVLRYGNKELYNKFNKSKGETQDDQAVDLYDGFIQLLINDPNFKHYKLEQLKNNPETLSTIELFALNLTSVPESDKKDKKVEENKLEYSPICPILFSTDKQIRETLENLFFGELIHKFLENPSMQRIKERQKEIGVIANSDKPFIIEKIREILSTQNGMEQFRQIIDNRYVKVKMDVLLGKGEEAFSQFKQFSTNISANEIIGRQKDTSGEDLYEFLQDLVKSRKGSEK